MNKSFTIERNGKLMEHVVLMTEDGNVWFQDVMSMPYDELVNYEHIDAFVVGSLDASNNAFDEEDGDTVVTLVDDETGTFIWSVVIFPESDDNIRYEFHDWLATDERFKYAEES